MDRAMVLFCFPVLPSLTLSSLLQTILLPQVLGNFLTYSKTLSEEQSNNLTKLKVVRDYRLVTNISRIGLIIHNAKVQ